MQPNLKEFADGEIGDLAIRVMELDEQGLFEEAGKLRSQVPLLPGIANNRKERMGIQALIESGANLSKAVKEYGHEWLENN